MTLYTTIITTSHTQILHICFLCLSFYLGYSSNDGLKNLVCIDQERDALLAFKNQIEYDRCGLMKTWGVAQHGNSDCCKWKGVSCSNHTGHVVRLNLRGGQPYSCMDNYKEITPSLGELKHLEYLDLSSNDFYFLTVPSFIGSLVNLRYLNLSNSNFVGEIPDQLGNLTRLVSLDLSYNYYGLSSNNLNWLSRLTLVKDINLSNTNLTMATNWSLIVGSLPLLEVLKMEECGLPIPLPLSFFKSPNLRFISLPQNGFTRLTTLHWLLNNTNTTQLEISTNYSYSSLERSLEHLDLSSNSFEGSIPDSIGNFKFLTHLDLSYNLLTGSIPHEIGNLKSLSYLDLHNNSLSSSIPDSIGNLTSLTHLDLSHNSFKGIIPNTTGNLESLTYFDMSHNRLLSTIPTTIGNLKSLKTLDFSVNSLFGIIPDSIENLESLEHIDLSENSLSGSFLSTLQGFSTAFQMMHSLSYLNFSNNNLHGLFLLSAMESMKSITCIDLSNNRLQGPIPSDIGTLLSLSYLDISKNNLKGSIPSSMGDLLSISHIDLSNNQLQGQIPSTLGYPSSLSYLDLSNNNLEGTIPSTLVKLEYLIYLDLSSNNLAGDIPCQFGFFQLPPYVNFSYNNLSGPIPKYLLYLGFEDFQGNPYLYREKLQSMCEETDILPSEEVRVNGDGDDRIYRGLYISIVLGFIVGFWGFCGSLTMKTSWRFSYFRIIDQVINKIYVTIALCLGRCRTTSRV